MKTKARKSKPAKRALAGIESQVRVRTAALERESARVRELLAEAEKGRHVLLSVLEDQRQAEAERRLAEERFTTLFRASPDAITLTSSSGRIHEANESASRLTGYTHEELIGHTTQELGIWADPADRDRYTSLLQQDGRVTNFEAGFRTKSGELRASLISGEIIRLQDGQYILGVIRDVTERKRAAEVLRESEERYRTVAELISDYAYQFRVDPDGVPVNEWITDSFPRAVGLPLAEMRARGGWTRFMHPDDLPLIRRHAERVLNAGSDECEFRFVTAAGETRWVRNYARAVRDLGAALRIYGAAQDITERKRAEEALRDSERQFRTLAETTSAVILLYDENDRILFANPATTAISGFSHDELLGMSLWDLIHPDFREHVRRRREARDRDEPIAIRSELKFVTKSGEEYWVDYTVGFVELAGKRTGIGTAFDITARKQAEAALRESEVQFRSIIDVSPVPYALNDEQQNITFLNPAFTRTFGYILGDIATLADWWPKAYPDPEYRRWVATNWQARLEEAKRNRATFEPMELVIRCKDGALRTVIASAAPLGESFEGTHLVVLYDITERKQAEAALRVSEERLRLALDAAHMGTFDWGVPHNRITWSRWHEELWGFKPGEFGGTYEAFSERLHPEDLPDVNAEVARCIAAREPFVREFRVVWPDGSVHWAMARGEFTFDEHGQAVRMRGVVMETTERKQAEEHVRKSGQRLRDLIDGLGPYMFVGLMTLDGTLIEANQPALAAAGLKPEDVLGKPFEETYWWAYSEEVKQQLRDAIARARRGEASRYDVQVRAAEDQFIDIDFSLQPLRDETGRVVFLVPSANVITERKQTEVTLRATQLRLEEAQARACLGSWEIDPAIERGYWSAEMYRIYDRDPALGVPTFAEFFELVHPEDRGIVRRAYAETLESGQPLGIDFRTNPQRRTVRYLNGTFVGVRDAEGKVVRLAGTVLDITERKQAEEERERLQAALRRSEMMAATGSLVAGVAHEVRNPLFGISATLDAFEARFGTQEGYQQYLTVLRGEVNRLTDLMRDLLEYGKPVTLAVAPEAIDGVIAAAVAACASLADAAGVPLVVEGTATAAVVVDRDRMRQVFQNLLQNAIQHSPRGSVVTVDTREIRDDGASLIECVIKDSGPGFREEDLPRVFEPFFSRRRGGTGLGLSIVERIVEEHHGEVQAANRAEGGAVVTVRLPAAM